MDEMLTKLAVQDAVTRFNSAYDNHDWPALRALVEEDFVLDAEAGVIEGADAFVEAAKARVASFPGLRALHYLSEMNARGGTAIAEALEMSLDQFGEDDRLKMVFFATETPACQPFSAVTRYL